MARLVTARCALALWLSLSATLWASCQRPYGRLEYVSLQSRAERKLLRYSVYLPPGWDRVRPLPLVVLLHGAGDDATSVDRKAVVEGLDRAIRAGLLPAFVMVAPDGERGFWVNWHDGSHHYRDWVMDEVIPAVRARFPLLPEPRGLHLIGVSMGGGGGLQLWLHERERFASVSVLSAPILAERETRDFLQRFVPAQVVDRVFGPSGSSSGIDPYAELADAQALRDGKLLFGAASEDRAGILGSNRKFHAQLDAHAVPHAFLVFQGKHRWTTWAEVFPFALCLQLADPCRMPLPRGLERYD